jgi:hypothetical protein
LNQIEDHEIISAYSSELYPLISKEKMNQSNASAIPFIPENPLCKNILKKFMDEESADIVFEVGSGSEQGENTCKREVALICLV